MTKKLIGILSVGIALAALVLVLLLTFWNLELREVLKWLMRVSWWLLLLTLLMVLLRKVWSLPRIAWLMPLSLSLLWLILCSLLWMSLLYKLVEHFRPETVEQIFWHLGAFSVLLSVLLLMGILKVTMFRGSRRVSARSASEAEDRVGDALDHIKKGWVAGLISGGITLIIWMLAALGAPALANQLDLDSWSFVDVILIFGLAYGVYRKSRTCAVIMFLMFFAAGVYNLVTMVAVSFVGLPVFILTFGTFGYYFGQAVRGTFYYHSLIQRKLAAAAPSKPVSESTSRPV